jgi:hypothetical protein
VREDEQVVACEKPEFAYERQVLSLRVARRCGVLHRVLHVGVGCRK